MGGSQRDQDTLPPGLLLLPSHWLTLRARVGAAGDSGVVAPPLIPGQGAASGQQPSFCQELKGLSGALLAGASWPRHACGAGVQEGLIDCR
eukprot:1018237-Alexandrium_andersonii.AAC.1